LTPRRLFDVIATGASADPVIRALAPAAVHAELAGDGLPLSRLIVATLDSSGRDSATTFNPVVYRATACEELPPLWWRTASVGERENRLASELAADEQAFEPFGDASASEGTPGTCLHWKVDPAAPTVTGPGPPDVPVLLLAGTEDTITPIADAQAVAQRYPHATLVVVPDMGHAVLATKQSNGHACAKRALTRFFASKPFAPCTASPPMLPPLQVPPVSLAELPPWPSLPGDRGRIVHAVVSTLTDAWLTTLSPLLKRRGLRGGTLTGADPIVLHDIRAVGGVRISGTFSPARGTAKLRVIVNGAIADLTLRKRVLIGTVLGHSVHAAVGRLSPRRPR
jgi:hypothetical protein